MEAGRRRADTMPPEPDTRPLPSEATRSSTEEPQVIHRDRPKTVVDLRRSGFCRSVVHAARSEATRMGVVCTRAPTPRFLWFHRALGGFCGLNRG